MPTDRLWNSLTFTNVADGDSVALPHGLVNTGAKKVPDFGWVVTGGFTAVADDTNVTVTNNTGGVASTDVLVCAIHSITRVFGGSANLTTKPFWVIGSAGLSSGGGSPSNLVVWTEAKTWATVYAEILALDGPVICLVENNASGHTMTPEGAGAPTDLTQVQFQGLQATSFGVAPGGSASVLIADGVVLDVNDDEVAVLNGLNVNFTVDGTTPIVDGASFALMLAGGGLTTTNGPAAVDVAQFRGIFSEGAAVGNNVSGTVQLAAGADAVLNLFTDALLGSLAFLAAGPTAGLVINTDGTCFVATDAFGANVAPVFLPTSEASMMLLSFGNQSISTATTARYLDPGYNQGTAGTTLIGVRAPCGGVLRRLTAQLNAADASAETVTFTISINNSPVVGGDLVLPANAVGGDIEPNGQSYVNAGDLVSIVVTRSGTLTSGTIKVAASVELFGIVSVA